MITSHPPPKMLPLAKQLS